MFKILVCTFLHLNAVYSVYFTMTNLSFALPGDKSKFPPSNFPLLVLYAMPENVNNDMDHKFWYNVSIEKGYLQMYHSTGDLMLRKEFYNKKALDGEVISATAYVEDSKTGSSNSTQLKITVSDRELECNLIIADLCFWKSVNYRIYENTNPSLIGSFSPLFLLEMCKEYKTNYTLIEGSNQFKLEPPSTDNKLWTLHSTKPLERDVIRTPFATKSNEAGELRSVSVKCYVETPKRIVFDDTKDMVVKVLDEDDNPPIIHSRETIHVLLDSEHVKKDQMLEIKEVLITDRDSTAVNHYDIRILDDKLGILEEKCMIYEDDRDAEPQTAIHCKIRFTKDTQISQFPYHVVLQFNDTTLLPGNGKSEARIDLIINFKGNPGFMSKLESTEAAFSEIRTPPLLFPRREIKIFRTAAPLARVVQPDEIKAKTFNMSEANFSVKNDSSGGGFQITNGHGIIFVENTSLIRNSSSPIRLELQWFNKTSFYSDILYIALVDEPTVSCTTLGFKVKDWKFCAKNKTPKDCLKTCGLATGGSSSVDRRAWYGSERCMWRGDKIPGTTSTSLYSTCTPDIKTCPDGICDELESLHSLICPQDCSEDILIPSKKNPKTHKGLEVGEGVCFCTRTGQCSCIDPPDEKKKRKSLSNETAPTALDFTVQNSSAFLPKVSQNKSLTAGYGAGCGTPCIFGIFLALMFLSVSIGIVVYCWRNNYKRKFKRNRSEADSQNLSVPVISERMEHQDSHLLNLDFTSDIASDLAANNRNIEVDPEWEFPRDKLIIEQVLGEGEFGRVLRAKALNIAGNVGYTTVAVKTLKDDAGERELSDLLSEYRLLKDVTHPNVIRLLGASTSPGGPVYLIIEFAEYGSLRTYLRKCRQIKSEPNIRCSTGEQWTPTLQYDEPKIFTVSARDIISFAWQIAKGMAYLSDMKLVHRDLAARNILLAAEKVCKVSDFGLTRDVYEDDAYLKKSKGRVPVKWMAPESLSDQIYTNKSDVWSFGVLVWELVTLGASPYPGIAVQSLFHLLRSGYRMERPENCSVELYQIMRNCWEADPEKRLSFSELAGKFEKMLSEEVQYLDVSGNAVYNRGYFLNQQDIPQQDQEENVATSPTEKNTSDPVNYLERIQQYIKCGESNKLDVNIETSAFAETELEPLKNDHTNQGYETPIKVSSKISNLQTPTNGYPRYGYTDMNLIKKV